jgi:hypothetical protein
MRYYRAARWLRKIGLRVHVGHHVPLRAADACGLHVADNLRLQFASVNLASGNRLPETAAAPGPLPGQFFLVMSRVDDSHAAPVPCAPYA